VDIAARGLDVDEIVALTSATDRDSVWLAAVGRRR
jgi:hypothetical protein